MATMTYTQLKEMNKEELTNRLEQVSDRIWDLEMGSLRSVTIRTEWENLRAERVHIYRLINSKI